MIPYTFALETGNLVTLIIFAVFGTDSGNDTVHHVSAPHCTSISTHFINLPFLEI